MNRTYKVIWSKARRCYVVVSELAKSQHKSSSKSEHISSNVHRGYLGKAAAAAVVASLLTFGILAYSPVMAADKDIVEKGAQPIAYDISPANDGTNIAVGKNAKVFIGGGTQESMLSFNEKADPTMWHGLVQTGWNIHSNTHAKQNLPESIAVGTNSYARTGSIEIGAHTLAENQIAIGDTTADKLRQFGVASTTLGTNSYTGGGFATTIGSYNVQTNQYEASGLFDASNATKNAFATVIGTFNSNESLSSYDSTSGVANMISGTANKVTNSNGAIVMGAGNSVKNSIDSFDTSSYSNLFKSAADMQKALMDGVAESAGGATLVIGGANKAENTTHSQIMGVGNKVKSTTSKKIEYNYLDGFNSSITDASHVKVLGQNVTINKGADSNTVMGDYRTVAENQTNNVIIGNADEKKPITTEKKETVILGYNANATVDGGVAIGSGSIANVGAGQKGYYVKHDQRSEEGQGYPFQKNDSAWISRAGAVSVGDTTNEDQSKWITRQITGVAAGTKDTDAVNVAQLKNSQTRFYSVYDPGDNWLDIFPQIPNWEKYKNENNQGAQGYYSMAAGFGTSTGGIASTVIGSMSKIDNKWTDGGPYGTQGATAVSVGTLNFNLSDQVTDKEVNSDDPIVTLQDKEDSGVANSIVGQANLTKNSNGALIYGAGNIVTDSYRRVFSNGDNDWDSLVNQDMSDLLSNPEKAIKTIGKVVDISGGKVMVMGGGNVVDKAYDSQVIGVGNTVTGSNLDFVYKESPEIGNITDQFDRDAAREADVWTQYMESIRKKGTLLNLVDGYYSTLKNGQNDYLIGTANEVTGDDASKNKSNIVFGDYHKLNNGSNNIIIGSADGAVVEKAQGYNEDDEYGINTSQEVTGQKQHTENLVDAVMIGHNADVQKNGGVALGAGPVAKGKNSLAAGVGALAKGDNSVAIGTNAKAQNDALAVGENASAGNTGIAIGMHANAGWGQNMALGYYASVANGVGNSTALGYGSQVTKRDILKSDGNDGVVSVGRSVGQSGEKGMTRRIINVKAGVNDTDAVNVSQLKQRAQAATTEVVAGTNIASVTKNDKTADGHTIYTVNAKGTTVSGDGNFNITPKTDNVTNVTDYAISLKNTITIGSGTGTHPVTINGTKGEVSGLTNTTWDKNADYSTSTKAATEAQLQRAMKDAQEAAEANDTDTHVKAGTYAVTTVKDAAGKDTQGVALNVVDKTGTPVGQVTITDVAKASDVGDVSKLSKEIQNAKGSTTVVDAINNVNTKVDTVDNKVGDLNYSSTNYVKSGDNVTTSISNLDKAIQSAATEAGKHSTVSKGKNIEVTPTTTGGKTDYKVSLSDDINVNSVTAKTVTTDNLTVHQSAAVGGVTINKDGKGTIGGLTNKTWGAANITSGRAATEDQLQAATKNAVNYDDDSKTITLRADTTIKNVADTTIKQGSKDAVNAGTVYNETRVAKDGTFVKRANTAGENLSALDNQVTANTESIYHINNRVSDLDNRVNKVGAGAAALAALHPLDFDPDDKWDFAVGYGNYRNANSVAFGAFYRPNEDTMFSLGTNFGNGENMFNAGLSFKIGQGSGITTSKTAMAKKIESLEDTVDKQDKKIAELEALVKEQGEMIRQYVGKK